MTDFEYDVMQKKRIASQAKYRKRGSKSKKCSLPSDGMTKKQWKELCGPVVTYRMNEPLTWDELKSYPEDVQREYVTGLRNKYGVTSRCVAEMLGLKPSSFYGLGFNGIFSRGYKMTPEQKAGWSQFVGSVEGTTQQEAEKTQSQTAEEAPDTLIVSPATKAGMSFDMFTLGFSGDIDVNEIANSIRSLLGGRHAASIQVTVTLASDT